MQGMDRVAPGAESDAIFEAFRTVRLPLRAQ